MAPACACHGEPMYWNKDKRRPSGGFWFCAVKQRTRQQARHVSKDSYWHRPGGGYVQRRRRHLSAQRSRILDQLAQLGEERASC